MNFFAQPKLSLTQLLPTEGHMVMVIIIITKKSRPNSLLLLTGDFNVMSDGYENSKVTERRDHNDQWWSLHLAGNSISHRPTWNFAGCARGHIQSGENCTKFISHKQTWVSILSDHHQLNTKEHGDQANGADEDGTTFPGLGKIDYVLTEATVWIIIISCIAHMINQNYWPLTKGKKSPEFGTPHT